MRSFVPGLSLAVLVTACTSPSSNSDDGGGTPTASAGSTAGTTGTNDTATTTTGDPTSATTSSSDAGATTSDSGAPASSTGVGTGDASSSDGGGSSSSGGPEMCTQWSGAGILGDCLVSEGMADISACGPDAQDPFCLSNPYGSSGVCSYTCESLCDCPAPPEGFEAQYTCGDLTGDSTGECHLACGPTTPCPDDMLCFYNTVCHYGTPVPTYGDCVNEFGLPCADGDCLVDAAMPTLGVCGGFCDDASQCPVPETGDAEVTCIDVGGAMNECVLDCSAGQTCPDGMSCDEGACVWLVGG